MTKKELDDRLLREPFEPFRVNADDGKHYDITNPRLAVPTDNRLFLIFEQESWTDIVLRHITSIESLTGHNSIAIPYTFLLDDRTFTSSMPLSTIPA